MTASRKLAIALFLVVALVFTSAAAVGQTPPSDPALYEGQVGGADGVLAPEGTTIVAVIDDEVVDSVTVDSVGTYGGSAFDQDKISINPDRSDTVSFHVDSASGPAAVENPVPLESGSNNQPLTFPAGTFEQSGDSNVADLNISLPRTEVAAGNTVTPEVTATLDDGSTENVSLRVLESSNSTVAGVDGLNIFAKDGGNTTISASYGGQTDSTDLTVTGTRPAINLTANTSRIFTGQTVTFTATNSSSGAAIEGANVSVGDVEGVTNSNGNVSLTISTIGDLSATASPPDKSLKINASSSAQVKVSPLELRISQTPIAFNDVSIGTNKTTNISVENPTQSPLTLETPSIDGSNAFSSNASEFPTTIESGSNATLSVTFSPEKSGTATADLSVRNQTVAITGTGVKPRIDITSDQPLEITAANGQTANGTVTLSNDGTDSLDATLSVNDTGNYSLGTQVINVSEGETTEFNVTFDAPNNPDSREIESTLTIDPSNPSVEDRTIAVVGTVIRKEITLGATTVGVGPNGNVTVNETGDGVITVENTGTTTETLSATIDNDPTDIFGVSSADQQFTLESGEQAVIEVTATPTDTGTTQATLNVSNTNITETATVTVTGQAPGLNLTTSSIDFGSVAVNSTVSDSITITNDGNGTLRILNTSAGQPFVAPAPPTTTVQSGETVLIPVRFSPNTVSQSSVSGTFRLNTTARNETIALEGSTIDSNVSFDPPSRDREFGTVGIGGSATETLNLSNDGERFDINRIQIDNSAFSVSETPDSIPANGSETLSIEFTPTTAGSQTASVTIVEGSTGSSTVSASLSGTGQPATFEETQQQLRTGFAVAGGSTTGSIGIRNPAPEGTNLDITGLSIVDGSGDFTIKSQASNLDIAGGDRKDIKVEFAPADSASDGTVEATLRVEYSTGAESKTRDIPVTGTVRGPNPELSATTISAGELPLDQTRTRVVELRNDGGELFEIDSITTNSGSGVTADLQGIDRVAPGGTTSIAVTVEPDRRDTNVASDIDTNISITATDSDVSISDVNVNADVVSPGFDITTSSPLAFGDVTVGSASQETVEIKNTGNSTLELGASELTNSFSIQSGKQNLTIPAGQTETIPVAFEPTTVEDNITANLTLTPQNDPTLTETVVALEGNGTQADSIATINRSSIDLGDVSLGAENESAFEVTNDGGQGSTLTISGASIIGADSEHFSVEFTKGRSLGPGESERIDVTVNTTDADRGSLYSLVEIQTDDGPVTAAVAATAASPKPAIGIVSGADFETVGLGDTSTGEVELRNDGNAKLNVSNVAITGSDAAAFELDETPQSTLQPQETQRVDVIFDPSKLSNADQRARGDGLTAEASIELQPNATGIANASTELSAQATTTLVNTPQTLSFSSIAVGQTRTQNITVRNNIAASTPVTIESVTGISGPTASAFNATRSGDATLAPGESTTVRVKFTPDDPGRKFGTLTVDTNSTRQSVRKIALSNVKTTFNVNYGSVNVTYLNPTNGQQPTVNVAAGFEGRNATLRTARANVSSTAGNPGDFSLDYEYGTSPSDAAGQQTTVPQLTLDNTTATESNVTDIADVQYINATAVGTAISTGNENESTFQIEVSKATITEQNATNDSVEINETNVNIYHENAAGTGYEKPSDQELLFETRESYVYEVTTDSYSIFAVGVLEAEADRVSPPGSPAPSPPPSDDDPGGGGGGGGGAGGGGAGGGDDGEPQGPPSIQDIRTTLQNWVTPQTTSQTRLEDATSGDDGLAFRPSVVHQIIFNDESLTGNVSITDYGQPPQTHTEDLKDSIAADVAAVDEAISRDRESVQIISVTDIATSVPATADDSATVELWVDRSKVENASDLTVIKETYSFEDQETRWEEKPTEVARTTDDEVLIQTEVDSFSLFTVAEISGPGEDDGGGGGGGGGGDDGGSGVLPTASALLLLVVILLSGVYYGRYSS